MYVLILRAPAHRDQARPAKVYPMRVDLTSNVTLPSRRYLRTFDPKHFQTSISTP